MGKKKVRKFNPRPVIEYPPVPTKKWIPPDQRPKKKPKPAYVKPPGITHRLKISALGKVWHNFRKLGDRVILLGHYSETHKRFCYLSNGYQSPCNCLIAVLVSKFIETSKWTRETIDTTLNMGDQLYHMTINRFENPNKTHLKLNEVVTTFYYGLSKITMNTQGPTYTGQLFEDCKDAPFLINVLQDFFNDMHTTGILTTQKKFFAFWFSGKYFFLYDPTAHNELGHPWNGEPGCGYAMVRRFGDANDLVAGLYENVDKGYNAQFVITACAIGKIVQIRAKPPVDNEILMTHCALPKKVIEKFEPGPPDQLLPLPDLAKQSEKEMTVVELEGEERVELEPDIEFDEYSPEALLTGSLTDAQQEAIQRKELSKSKFPIEHPKAESVTYFTTLVSENMGILRASTHQSDLKFSKYEGAQSLSNALAAIAMLRVHKARRWIRKILDEVLLTGEKIHKTSLSETGSTSQEIEINGRKFTADIDEYTTIGQLLSVDKDVLDLLPALQEYFRNNDACIIAGPLTLAVWFEDGLYYMFDPNERNELGGVITKTVQVGSDIQVLETEPGTACVIWFKELKRLVQLYMHNVEKAFRRDVFVLRRVQINDLPSFQKPWNNFQGIATNKWILRATINQNDRRFDKETRNKQGTAIAAVALSYAALKHVKNFNTSDVDEIVIQGDAYYKITVKDLQEREILQEPLLSCDELVRKFKLEGKQIRLDIQDCMINGLLDAQDSNDASNLKKCLREFFEDNNNGIVTARFISVAVWKKDGVYYYFDSHSRDENGIQTKFGLACIIRVLTIDDLAEAIEANLPPGTENTFNISRFTVAVLELSDSGIVRPPLNNYTELNPNVAILRSTISEKSPEFKLNKGRQTVPMCLVAAGMTKVYPCALWSHDIVTEILHIGNDLFTSTMIDRERNAELPEDDDIDEVYAENCKMEYEIGFNKVNVSYDEAIEGNFKDDFEHGVTEFFDKKQDGEASELLVASDLYTVLAWRNDGFYYLFDPQSRDETGQVYGKCDWSVMPVSGEDEEEGTAYGKEFGGGDFSTRLQDNSETGEDGTRGGKRHSLSYWRKIEESGKACAMRFLTLDLLVSHITDNVPPTRRSEIQFKLLPLNVVNKANLKNVFDPTNNAPRPDRYAGDWNAFKEIDHGRWILRGTMDYDNAMFPEHNRSRQSIAMCYTALGYVARYALSKFQSVTIDDVLKYGDRLHTATRKIHLKQLTQDKDRGISNEAADEIVNATDYNIDNVASTFCIGVDEIRIDVMANAKQGDILAEEGDDVFDLKTALGLFFEESRYGILSAKGVSVAVWRGATTYYAFDPSSTGPCGIKCTNGNACMTRYLDLEALSDVFLRNVPKNGKNNFAIHKVTVRIEQCPREPKPEEKEPVDEPNYHGYAQVMPGKCLLRGTINQEDARFGHARNAQCAPIALVALTMTLLHKANIWTQPIIDDILVLGDELYTATLDTLGFEFNPWEQGMTLHLVNKDYKVGRLRANCELRGTDQRGIVDIKHPHVLNIRQGLEKFFEENTHGVIETETLTVAIWEDEEEKLIYMFDPNPRGPGGLPQTGGTACVITFETSKLAADHFISNIEKSKRNGEFVITPVEIIVGRTRTPPKKAKCPCAKKELDLKKRHPTPCVKKFLRKMAEARRHRRDMERQNQLGRDGYHELNNTTSIIRGTKCQSSPCFSEASRGNQDLPNCFAAFVLHRIVPVSEWHHKHIDLALEIGDQLYKDSFITYEPPDVKLGLRNILRKVFIKDVRVSLKVYKPIISGVLNQHNLEMALLNYFQQETFCILSAKNQHVCIFFKGGLYYMFDPHDRDLSGSTCEPPGYACVLRSHTYQNLAEKFISNVVGQNESMGSFTVTLLTIGDIHRVITECGPTKCGCL